MALGIDVPLQLTTRGLTPTENNLAKRLVRQYADRFGGFGVDITTCDVVVEKPQKFQDSGNPYRVRVHIRAPGHLEAVAVKEPGQHEMHESMQTVVKNAFQAAERTFREELRKRRGEVKRRDPIAEYDEDVQPSIGFVVRINHSLDFGFLMSPDGREVYFHRNAVLHDAFDEIHPGAKVRFEAELGEDGPQATSVQVLERVPPDREIGEVEGPRGWWHKEE